MKLLFILSLLFLLPETDPVTLDSFVKSQSEVYSSDPDPKANSFGNAITRYNLHSLKTEAALKSKKEHSITNSKGRTLYSRINLYKYNFESEATCLQVQDSLLKNFPSEPGTVKRGVNQAQKTTPSIIVFAPKSIVVALTACESIDKKWTAFKKDFVTTFAGDSDPIIVTDCGKLFWTTKAKIEAR